jgi:hypothetical protein
MNGKGEPATGSVVRPWRCQAAHPGSISRGSFLGVAPKKISSLCLIRSRVTIIVRHPPVWAVAEWVVWIRPISDGRPWFGDFLDQDLWFRDFLIEMLGGESSFPSQVFFNEWKSSCRDFNIYIYILKL